MNKIFIYTYRFSTLVILFLAPLLRGKTEIVLLAGKDSHGSNAHNWGEGVDLLSNALTKESGLDISTRTFKGGWPENLQFFKMQQRLSFYRMVEVATPLINILRNLIHLLKRSRTCLRPLCCGSPKGCPWGNDEKMAWWIF